MLKRRLLAGLLVALASALVAAGCGDDEGDSGSATDAAPAETTVPEDANEALDQAQEELDQAQEDLPENIDEAIQQCKDGVEQSEAPDDAKQNLLELCESGADAQETLEQLQDQLGN